MTQIHIRVLEIRTEETPGACHSFLVSAATSNITPKKSKVKGDTIKKCNYVWTYDIASQFEANLIVKMERSRMIIKDEEVAKLIVPLQWFPTNRVVRDWFPMKASDQTHKDAFILLDVHIDDRKCEKFMAAYSTLRIFPCWNRPQDPECECPAPPQIVYVIGNQPIVNESNAVPPYQTYVTNPQGQFINQPPNYQTQYQTSGYSPYNQAQANHAHSDDEVQEQRPSNKQGDDFTPPIHSPVESAIPMSNPIIPPTPQQDAIPSYPPYIPADNNGDSHEEFRNPYQINYPVVD